MTFEKTKIQVLIEEHGRMPLDHHNLPTAAKDCPLCKKATMTTEEKKQFRGVKGRYDFSNMEAFCTCGHKLGIHCAPNETGIRDCMHSDCQCKQFVSTPPETGREWEDKIDWKKQVEGSMSTVFINNRDTDVLKGSMKTLIYFLERRFHIIESSALAQGEKIGGEKERERIEKAFPHDIWEGTKTHKTDCRACIVGEAIDTADALKG